MNEQVKGVLMQDLSRKEKFHSGRVSMSRKPLERKNFISNGIK